MNPRTSYTDPGASIVAPCTASASATAASIGRVRSGGPGPAGPRGSRFVRWALGDASTVSGRSPIARRLFPFALALALAGCGSDDSSRPPTTTINAAPATEAAPTTTEAAPTTTEALPSCAELEQRKQDLEDEKKEIDERKKETKDEAQRDALEEQKKVIEEKKHVLDEQLRACR